MHYGRNVYSTGSGVDTIQTKPGFEKYQRRLSNAALSPVDRAHMASLYGAPPVPLSSVVTTTADGGRGSLRAAIYYAQDHPGTTISFDIPTSDQGYAGGAFTIKLTGSLPPLSTNGLTIDASTQPGYTGKPLVYLNGSKLLPEAGSLPGLLFYESGCLVKGLGFQAFPWAAVAMMLPDATGNRVSGCSMGVDSTGNLEMSNEYGVFLSEGAHGNVIGGTAANDRNVISGNRLYGVWMSKTNTTDNSIQGNYIGLNHTGTAALANHLGGVIFIDGANRNTIGGEFTTARNVISGNTDAGIWITGSGVEQNVIRGNYIGLNAAGTAAVANTLVGMYVIGGASNNTVIGNVISGNFSEGLRIAGNGTTANKVYGNLMGTNPSGNSPIPNGFSGVTIFSGANGNQVGGTVSGQRNIMSGNGTVGLAIGDIGTQGNIVIGNYIGTNADGTAAIPNSFAGVYITGGCSGNYLGDGPGRGNLISGNAVVGVYVAGTGTTGNYVSNNRIGPDSAGGVAITDQDDGI
ncbi:MAG: right-handed parallel beta-helix repeat-containing protein, partial [Luteolibacter sp.]